MLTRRRRRACRVASAARRRCGSAARRPPRRSPARTRRTGAPGRPWSPRRRCAGPAARPRGPTPAPDRDRRPGTEARNGRHPRPRRCAARAARSRARRSGNAPRRRRPCSTRAPAGTGRAASARSSCAVPRSLWETYSAMSPRSTPSPTIAAWWLTADTPSTARDTTSGSRTSPSISSARGIEVIGPLAVRGLQQRVEDAHLVPALEQRVDDVRADEAGTAGHEDHAAPRYTVTPRARRHPPRAQRARRHPVGAGADARRLHADRRRQRVHGRLGRRWRSGSARASWSSRRRGSARRASPGFPRRRARSCASWTATRRLTRATCRRSPTRSPAAPRT